MSALRNILHFCSVILCKWTLWGICEISCKNDWISSPHWIHFSLRDYILCHCVIKRGIFPWKYCWNDDEIGFEVLVQNWTKCNWIHLAFGTVLCQTLNIHCVRREILQCNYFWKTHEINISIFDYGSCFDFWHIHF